MPEVREMSSAAEVAATFPVMRQLRPHLDEGEYLERIRRTRAEGYRLAAVVEGEEVSRASRASGSSSSSPTAGFSTWTTW